MTLAETIPLPTRKRLRKMDRASPEAGGAMADILIPLAKAGRLTELQMRAAGRFLTDLQSDMGSSGNIAACYQERIQSSMRAGSGFPGGWTQTADRVQSVLDSLRPGERDVLGFLIRNRELSRRRLSDFGESRSGYSSADMNGALAVGLIQAMLDGLVAAYQKHAPEVFPTVSQYARLKKPPE